MAEPPSNSIGKAVSAGGSSIIRILKVPEDAKGTIEDNRFARKVKEYVPASGASKMVEKSADLLGLFPPS